MIDVKTVFLGLLLATASFALVPTVSAFPLLCDNAAPTFPCYGPATNGAAGGCVWTVNGVCVYFAQREPGYCLIYSLGVEQVVACDLPVICDNHAPASPCVGPASDGANGACLWTSGAVCVYVALRGDELCLFYSFGVEQEVFCTAGL